MGARYKGCLINVGWPQPGSRLEGRRRGSSSWEAPGSLEETSAVQPAAWPSRFLFHSIPGMYTVGAESMQVPLDQMVLCCFRRSFRSSFLIYGKESSSLWGEVGGAVRGGPKPRASLLSGSSALRGFYGSRTWNLDCGARSVQEPLSAAARIDTARPWGQISLPKSLWPPRRRSERVWGGKDGFLRMGAPAVCVCGRELGIPMGGIPPFTLCLGSLETASGGPEGSWM